MRSNWSASLCRWTWRGVRSVGVWLGVLVVLAVTTGADAAHRYFRRLDETSGLAVATVTAVVQDREGFLWLGTHGGLVRFDGHGFDRWARDGVPGSVMKVVARPERGVLALLPRGALLRTTETGVEPVPGPRGVKLIGITDAAYDVAGRLWVIRDGRVWIRARAWGQPDPVVFGRYPPRYLCSLGKSMAVLTTRDVRLIDSSGQLEQVIPISGAADVVRRADGGFILLRLNGQVLSAPPSAVTFTKVLTLPGKGVALAVRGAVVWAAFDRFLARIGPGDATDVMGLAEGVPSGGRLLVDREGSMWMGTFSGLLQFPEPDTTIWTDLEGLPSAHARYVARSGDGVLVSTWQGLGRVGDDGAGWRATTEPVSATGRLCTGSTGAVWFGNREGLYRYRGGRARRVIPGPHALRGCATGGTGLWLAGEAGLQLVRNGVPATVPLWGGTDGGAPVDSVLETTRSELIWVSGTRICRQPVEAALAGSPAGRTCWDEPEVEQAFDLAQIGDEVWLAGRGFGILRLGRRGAVEHPGVETLPSRVVFSLARSPRGGVWIAGKGFVRRVLACPECPGGWRVLETLGPWQGLPSRSGGQVLELADGNLWIPTDNGLIHVLPAARARPVGPPAVVIVEVLRNGEQWQPRSPLILDWNARRLDLRFAALSFRDPAKIRYRSRVDGRMWSRPWTSSRLTLSGLAPGRHSVAVQASVDEAHWSSRAAALRFRVRPPWWQTWWAFLLATAAVAGVLSLVRSFQLASLARVERERERIAGDLHDQVGSGLASIGILASMGSGELLSPERRIGLARDIGDVSARLSFTLRAIVWSLRDQHAGLRDTAAQLADHGAKLLGGPEGSFEVIVPERWPPGPLPLLVRRNLLLIGLEALHNISRHAHAERVQLAVAPAGDGLWRLSIADDGVGFRPEEYQDSAVSLGLHSMWRRAEAIGARLAIESAPGAGAIVTLTFDPCWAGAAGRRHFRSRRRMNM
ncbi:MAG: hypothetical protein GXP48_00360 [Acidobacteria bacterium]|nr:hypothetical protein [Acidobacteriota bacterium]